MRSQGNRYCAISAEIGQISLLKNKMSPFYIGFFIGFSLIVRFRITKNGKNNPTKRYLALVIFIEKALLCKESFFGLLNYSHSVYLLFPWIYDKIF